MIYQYKVISHGGIIKHFISLYTADGIYSYESYHYCYLLRIARPNTRFCLSVTDGVANNTQSLTRSCTTVRPA